MPFVTCEAVNTTLEERIMPGLLFLFKHAPHLSITQMQCVHYASFSAMFSQLYSITNEEHYKKDLGNQSSHNGKLGQFPLQM